MKERSIQIIESGKITHIVFRPKRYPLTLSGLFTGMLVFSLIDWHVCAETFSEGPEGTIHIPSLLLGLLITAILLMVSQAFIFMLLGKEILSIEKEYVQLTYSWMISFKQKRYKIKDISHLRISDEDKLIHNNAKRNKKMVEHLSYMAIRFNYNQFMIVFARGIEYEEGLQVLELLQSKHNIKT